MKVHIFYLTSSCKFDYKDFDPKKEKQKTNCWYDNSLVSNGLKLNW